MVYRTPITVMHLMGPLRPSGMERMLVSGAPYFADEGVEQVVIGQGSEHSFAAMLRDAGCNVEIIPHAKSVRGVMALVKTVSRWKPDIVHIHTERAFGMTAALLKIVSPKSKMVRTIHSIFLPRGRAKLSRRLQSWVADRFIDVFVAPSPDVQSNELDYGRNCRVIYNWVDDAYLELFNERMKRVANATDRKSVLIVGNGAPVKNHRMVLELIERLPLDLYFHGDESGSATVERQLLDRIAQDGRLRYRGTGAPHESLLQASAFLMPSKVEGMSVSLAEALTVGVPALVNDVRGLRWSSGHAGVITVRDDETAWREALTELAFGYKRVETERLRAPVADPDFSAARGVAEYVGLYRILLGRKDLMNG